MTFNTILSEINVTFDAKFSEINMDFNTEFSEINMTFNTKFDNVISTIIESEDIPKYKGDYDIVPEVEEQILPTKNTLMADDITIKSIPFFSVSNSSGGDTVYIAEEV